MDSQQFEIIHDLLKTLHNKVESMDDKLSDLTVETAKQELRINDLEKKADSNKKFTDGLIMAMIGVVLSLAIPALVSFYNTSPLTAKRKSPCITATAFYGVYKDGVLPSNHTRHKQLNG